MDALNQLRSLQSPATGTTPSVGKTSATPSEGGEGASFKDVLMKNLGEVNQLQQEADQKLEDFVTGKNNNMGEVVSASQKASMAFSMLVQIRNKLQESYDELKNLRV